MVFPIFSLVRSPQSTLSVVNTIFLRVISPCFLLKHGMPFLRKKCLFCPCWWIKSQVCYILLVRSSFLLLHSTTSHFSAGWNHVWCPPESCPKFRAKPCFCDQHILQNPQNPTEPQPLSPSHVRHFLQGGAAGFHHDTHLAMSGCNSSWRPNTHTKRKNIKSWYNAYSNR